MDGPVAGTEGHKPNGNTTRNTNGRSLYELN